MDSRVRQGAATFKRLFERMDRNDDGAVNAKEVVKHLKSAKVPGGLFGLVHKKARDGFMKNLDDDGNGRVTWKEFQGVAGDLLPQDLKDAQGRIDVDKADEVFTDFDADGDGAISEKELKKGTLERLPEDASFRGTTAEVAARLGVDALDADGDAKISRQEFDQAVFDASELIQD